MFVCFTPGYKNIILRNVQVPWRMFLILWLDNIMRAVEQPGHYFCLILPSWWGVKHTSADRCVNYIFVEVDDNSSTFPIFFPKKDTYAHSASFVKFKHKNEIRSYFLFILHSSKLFIAEVLTLHKSHHKKIIQILCIKWPIVFS